MCQPKFPAFFNQAPTLLVQDKLAEFLGTAQNGIIEYRYIDAVRLCGHSCPTVAGAYLMVIKGLKALYGDDLPQRGDIEVSLQGARDQGTTGVTATVARLLTGAAPETGFAGIGAQGLFSRRHLLIFGADINGTLSLRRRDTGQAVTVNINSSMTSFADEMAVLMPKAINGTATPEEFKRFGELWQARVKTLLIDLADDPLLVHVEEIPSIQTH